LDDRDSWSLRPPHDEYLLHRNRITCRKRFFQCFIEPLVLFARSFVCPLTGHALHIISCSRAMQGGSVSIREIHSDDNNAHIELLGRLCTGTCPLSDATPYQKLVTALNVEDKMMTDAELQRINAELRDNEAVLAGAKSGPVVPVSPYNRYHDRGRSRHMIRCVRLWTGDDRNSRFEHPGEITWPT
jgi:hypothetical protein